MVNRILDSQLAYSFGISLVWLLSLVTFGVFFVLFIYSVLLMKISKLREVRYFSIAALGFLIAALFEMLIAAGQFNSALLFLSEETTSVMGRLGLLTASIFLMAFFHLINKQIEQYR